MSIHETIMERHGQLGLLETALHLGKASSSEVIAPLNIRMIPMNSVVGDLVGNAEFIAEEMASAERDGVELLLFPELALSGYPPEDLLLRQNFLDDCQQQLEKLATLSGGSAVVVGHPHAVNGRLYNACSVLRNGDIQLTYHKHQLPNYGVFDERRYFTNGSGTGVIEIDGQRVGITICEDIWVDGPPLSAMAGYGLDLLVNISASPYHRNKGNERHKLLAKRAREANCPIAYCNQAGGQDELVFDGHCLVIDERGEILAESPPFINRVINFNKNAHERYQALDASGEVYAALVQATKDYVGKSGFSEIVLGLSGGIDSALVLLIAVDALGAENVHAVVMPSPHSSAETQEDARQLARDCGVDLHELEIETLMQTYDSTLSSEFAGLAPDVTEENIQARIRGALLMALSNKFGWMLLSTGNKSENSVGYFTQYGDATGGYAPLRDLPKTLVYELSEWRESQGDFITLMQIIKRPPSAELRPDQQDTDSLPPYEILDPILEMYLEHNLGIKEIVSKGYQQNIVERIIKLVNIAEFKRRQAPPGPKITIKAFGKDRRMPICNSYKNS